MNNFDNKTANLILKTNFGFQKVLENNVFTFRHRMVDGELEFYGFEILDGCDEYYSMILDERTCVELAKGFLELAMCFKADKEKERRKMRLIDANSIGYCNYDLDNYHSFCAVTKEEIDETPTILWL